MGTGDTPYHGGVLLSGTFDATALYPVADLTVDTSNAGGWINSRNAFSASASIMWRMDGASAFTYVKATVQWLRTSSWAHISRGQKVSLSQANYARYDVEGCTAAGACTVLMDGSETDLYSNGEMYFSVIPTGLTFKYFKIVKDSTGSGPWMGGLMLTGKLTGNRAQSFPINPRGQTF